MFRTQSFQNFNMMYDAFGSWRAAANRYRLTKADGNEQAMKEAQAALSDARETLRGMEYTDEEIDRKLKSKADDARRKSRITRTCRATF